MPLLKPDVQEALRSVGLAGDKEATIDQRLNEAGLSLDTSLSILSDIAHGADKSSEKLRAIETTLKLRGILKEQQAPPPSITIVINDSESEHKGLNPILLPRQLNTAKKDTVQ